MDLRVLVPPCGVVAMDLVYLGLIVALALATAGYLWLCDRLGDKR